MVSRVLLKPRHLQMYRMVEKMSDFIRVFGLVLLRQAELHTGTSQLTDTLIVIVSRNLPPYLSVIGMRHQKVAHRKEQAAK